MSARPPPTSATARGLRLGRAGLRAGADGVVAQLRGGAPDASASARVLVGALLELRGAALKVAQFLALESDLLPPAALRELARASHRVPPMGPAFVRDRVRGELGALEERFASFSPTALAAASLGQVHAATLPDGRAVVVKVQYPGMAETVRSDLRLLRRAAGLLPHPAHHRRMLDEIEQRLLEECDYRHEAEALAWFGARLQVAGLSLPEVHAAWSGLRVLTVEQLHGHHLNDWLAGAPPQHERDRVGQCLYDTFMQSLHVLGRLHADPNPGNLLIGAGGSVSLLDFGCTRWIPADYQAIVTRIWRAAVRGDDAAAIEAGRAAGLYAALDEGAACQLDAQAMKPFRDWLAEPLRSERFHFGQDSQFVAEGRRRFMQTWRADALVGIRPEFVLVNRTLYGLFRLFEQLGARVRCQTPWTAG